MGQFGDRGRRGRGVIRELTQHLELRGGEIARRRERLRTS